MTHDWLTILPAWIALIVTVILATLGFRKHRKEMIEKEAVKIIESTRPHAVPISDLARLVEKGLPLSNIAMIQSRALLQAGHISYSEADNLGKNVMKRVSEHLKKPS